MAKQKKIVLISGLTTAGKSTTSYELTKVLPGWIFIDIWKIKDFIFIYNKILFLHSLNIRNFF